MILNPIEYNQNAKTHACAKMLDQRLWQSKIISTLDQAQTSKDLQQCRWFCQNPEKIIKNLAILLPFTDPTKKLFSFVDMQGFLFQIRLQNAPTNQIGGLFDLRDIQKIGKQKYKIAHLKEYQIHFDEEITKKDEFYFSIDINTSDHSILEQTVNKILKHLKLLQCKVYKIVPLPNDMNEQKTIKFRRRFECVSQENRDFDFLRISVSERVQTTIHEIKPI